VKKTTIREAKKEDGPAIKALIRMFPENLMQQYLPSYRSFFVAEKAGKIVACCALQVYSKRMCEVRSLAVHPEHRRQGIARNLVNACVARAKHLKIVEVYTVTGVKQLFEAADFRVFNGEKYAMFIVLGR